MVIMADFVVIALFRHGLTEENKRGGYLGWNDSPLVKNDFSLTLERYEQYFCSDLQRCVTTAQILFPDGKPRPLKELREMHFGDWQGKTYDDLKEDLNYQAWVEDLRSIAPPNGESFAQFAERVEGGWAIIRNEILKMDSKTTAIVTHGGVIRYLLMKYAPVEKDFWDWKIPHGTGYEMYFDKEALRDGGKCTSLQAVPSMEKSLG